ncbi:MAG: hypothetical protein RSF01_03410 [Bacteroidales bacterium]
MCCRLDGVILPIPQSAYLLIPVSGTPDLNGFYPQGQWSVSPTGDPVTWRYPTTREPAEYSMPMLKHTGQPFLETASDIFFLGGNSFSNFALSLCVLQTLFRY